MTLCHAFLTNFRMGLKETHWFGILVSEKINQYPPNIAHLYATLYGLRLEHAWTHNYYEFELRLFRKATLDSQAQNKTHQCFREREMAHRTMLALYKIVLVCFYRGGLCYIRYGLRTFRF